MSLTTITSVISSETDTQVVLKNHAWAGKLDIATSWTTLRLGLRWSMEDSGLNLYDPRLYVGLLSNPNAPITNGPLNASSNHFMGAKFSGVSSLTWVAGPPPAYNSSGISDVSAIKKVGTTETTTVIDTGNTSILAGPAANRHCLFMEITKGSPNYTLRWGLTTAGVGSDVAYSELITAMGQSSVANIATYLTGVGKGGIVNSTGAVACNEGADGTLNALYVGWPSFYPALYISDYVFRVMA